MISGINIKTIQVTPIVRRITLYIPNSMKHSAVVFFLGFLAFNHGSSAHKCKPNVVVNISLVADNYGAFIGSLPRPSLEYGDKAADGFENTYTSAVQYYSRHLTSNLREEAQYRGEELVIDIKSAMDQLRGEIASLPKYNRESNCLEAVFERVLRQMIIFLELKPEKTNFEMPKLPSLPEQTAEIESRSAIRSQKEIFMDWASITDSLAHQIYIYLTTIFLQGWEHVREDFEIVRTQVYKAILNGPVVNAYGDAVREIEECRDVICDNVSRKSWRSFEIIADRIIALLENCNSYDDGNYSY